MGSICSDSFKFLLRKHVMNKLASQAGERESSKVLCLIQFLMCCDPEDERVQRALTESLDMCGCYDEADNLRFQHSIKGLGRPIGSPVEKIPRELSFSLPLAWHVEEVGDCVVTENINFLRTSSKIVVVNVLFPKNVLCIMHHKLAGHVALMIIHTPESNCAGDVGYACYAKVLVGTLSNVRNVFHYGENLTVGTAGARWIWMHSEADDEHPFIRHIAASTHFKPSIMIRKDTAMCVQRARLIWHLRPVRTASENIGVVRSLKS